MFNKIAVIGPGIMGHGIAQTYALAGFPVSLYDIDATVLLKANAAIEANLALLVEENVISDDDKSTSLNRITCTTDLEEAVSDADFITEAVPEVLTLKYELYKEMEKLIGFDTIIASNTSTFPISQLIKNLKSPNRFVITHFKLILLNSCRLLKSLNMRTLQWRQ